MQAFSPATTRRRLRTELRRMRDAAGLSQAEVVQKLDWSQSKLIRIENGSVGISVTDARALLNLYGAPAGVDSQLIELARSSRVRTWWSAYRDVLSQPHQEFLGFEADARRLRQLHPFALPGLLQTESYMRASLPVLSVNPLEPSTLDTLVAVRLRRQAEILSGTDRPDITFIIDEAALRRPVGGSRVMRDQLEQLAATETRAVMDNEGPIRIAVLPFSAGPHIGMSGAFHIMDFDDDVDDSVLYLEGAAGDLSLRDNPDLVSAYARQFDDLLTVGLTGERASSFIRRIAAELEG